MTGTALAVLSVYVLLVAWLATYAAFELRLLIHFLRLQPRNDKSLRDEGALPAVTVQIPLFNERENARTIIEAACALQYPNDRLEVQVLDDSNDGTREVVDAAVREQAARGVRIRIHRRPSREGYKAGALDAALPHATGEYVAIFDADFQPKPDFLHKVFRSGVFSDPRVAFAQARWTHKNRTESWLTRAQSLLIDRHFIVEKPTRAALGWITTFNGSAGIFRRQSIAAGGGWQPDTICEDFDLSFRLAEAGYRGAYLPDIQADSLLPSTVAAFKIQQRRWALGSTQVLTKLARLVGPGSRLPHRATELILLAGYAVHVGGLLNLLLWPVFVLTVSHHWMFWVGQVVITLSSFVMPACLATVVRRRDGRLGARAVVEIASAVLLGFGLVVTSALAVLWAAIVQRHAPFERTPKSRSEPAALPPSFYVELLVLAYCIVGAIGLASLGFGAFLGPLVLWGLCIGLLVVGQVMHGTARPTG